MLRFGVPPAGPRPTNPRPAWNPDLRDQLQACRGELAEARTELAAVNTELATCRAELNALQVQCIVNAAISSGKLLPDLREWAEFIGRSDRATLIRFIDNTLALVDGDAHSTANA